MQDNVRVVSSGVQCNQFQHQPRIVQTVYMPTEISACHAGGATCLHVKQTIHAQRAGTLPLASINSTHSVCCLAGSCSVVAGGQQAAAHLDDCQCSAKPVSALQEHLFVCQWLLDPCLQAPHQQAKPPESLHYVWLISWPVCGFMLQLRGFRTVAVTSASAKGNCCGSPLPKVNRLHQATKLVR